MTEQRLEISQAAGIVRDKEGFAFIPATQRPDGSWRKPRRVKDGYVPDEDVERYKNRVARSRADAPACPGLATSRGMSVIETKKIGRYLDQIPSPIVAVDSTSASKAKKKNLKRKQQREKKKNENMKESIVMQYESVKSQPSNLTQELSNLDLKESKDGPKLSAVPPDYSEEARLKKIKNLTKKLRQINELEEKINNGTIAKPDKSQSEKLSKRKEVEAELNQLENLN